MSTYTWRFEAADASPLHPSGEPASFPSQADAESWVGESWRALLAEGVEQPGHVATERGQIVCLDLVGDRAVAVAAHVGRDRAVARLGERGELVAPRVPELREAVAEHDGRALALRRHVQLNAVRLDPAMGHAA